MNNIYTQNQSKDKTTSVKGYWINTVSCSNNNTDEPGITIQLTGLESMWYNHEENVNHPEGSDYPESINVPFMKLMRQRIVDSIIHRTGIDIRTFDNVIHASTSPGRNPDGTIIEDVYSKRVIRNEQPQDGVFSEYALEGLENC
tara:strand:+ start:65 stop:496 length:432 start_codon:yes stop_codon:yes gene_type:complete